MNIVIELIAASILGYLVSKLEKMDDRLDKMEIELALLKRELPRRENDISH